MKLFITGATGSLGTKTVEFLSKQNHEIYALVQSKSKSKKLKETGTNTIVGDLFDKKFMIENTKGFDGLIHLASSVPKKFNTKAKDWKEHIKLQIDAVKILANVIMRNKISFYIQPSSLLGYGHRKGNWIDESIKLPYPVKTYYELDQEFLDVLELSVKNEYILNTVFKSHFPRIILRLGLLYGPDSFHTQELLEQVEKNVFPIIDKGTGYLNLIHVDDAASAIAYSVNNHEKLLEKTFNISDDNPVSNDHFIRYLAKKLGAKDPKAVSSKIGNMLIGKFEANIIQSSFRNKNDKFKQVTGWSPHYKSYRDGFESILEIIFYYS